MHGIMNFSRDHSLKKKENYIQTLILPPISFSAKVLQSHFAIKKKKSIFPCLAAVWKTQSQQVGTSRGARTWVSFSVPFYPVS